MGAMARGRLKGTNEKSGRTRYHIEAMRAVFEILASIERLLAVPSTIAMQKMEFWSHERQRTKNKGRHC